MHPSWPAFASLLLVAAGCLGSFGLDHDHGDGGAGVDVGGDFNAHLAPLLSSSCGACHSKQGGVGPGFLEPKPDMLTTMLSYPGMIGATPEVSRIYAKGLHEGPALSDAQKPIVADWIVEYNANKPAGGDGGVQKPIITPFKPVMGANVIDLAQLD